MTVSETVHNPDRYMSDFRQILAQGRKRIGILLGAGAPVSIKVNSEGSLDEDGEPLIPAVAALTAKALAKLEEKDKEVVSHVSEEIRKTEGLDQPPNIEMILSRIRSLGQVVGSHSIHGYASKDFVKLGKTICDLIGIFVQPKLPSEITPYSEVVSWISGVDRPHPVEVFTTNYDLLLEEALERNQVPYFDGFVGSYHPFFDPSTTSKNDLPARWVRLWKLHGSLGWGKDENGNLIRGLGRRATECIFPDHLKYEQIQKLPYTAFFDRLRKFLTSPDTLLISAGFSYFDSHVSAVIDESLAANASASVFAFQHAALATQSHAVEIAVRRSNMSVFSPDKAVINSISAPWRPGQSLNDDWLAIRAGYWHEPEDATAPRFLLGGFQHFSRFLALSQAEQVESVGQVEEPTVA